MTLMIHSNNFKKFYHLRSKAQPTDIVNVFYPLLLTRLKYEHLLRLLRRKIRVNQNAIKRKILGVILSDHKTLEYIIDGLN